MPTTMGFLFLVPKDTKGVPEGAHLLGGAYRVGHDKRSRCSPYTLKAPKVGSKVGRVVPSVTNCDSGAAHVGHGYQLPTTVHAHRPTRNGVDRSGASNWPCSCARLTKCGHGLQTNVAM